MAVEVALVGTVALFAAVSSSPTFVTVATIVFESNPRQRVVGDIATAVVRAIVRADFTHRVLAFIPTESPLTITLEVRAVAVHRAIE